MKEMDQKTWLNIISFIPKKVCGLFRIQFCFKTEIDMDLGPFEIHFFDGSILLLKSGGGGDFLVTEEQAWSDPFANWPKERLARQINEFGAYRRFDWSEKIECKNIIGMKLTAATPIYSQFGNLVGVEMNFQGSILTMYCGADEEYVFFGEYHKRLREMGFLFGESYVDS